MGILCIGQVWRENESSVWNDLPESETAEQRDEVSGFDDFAVDWSAFDKPRDVSIEPAAEGDDRSGGYSTDQGPNTDQVDEFESTDIPDSIFGSLPSTPTDVTSLWGDFPADANEAFADALDEFQTENSYSDRIIEETEVIVQQTIKIDGVEHYYLHKAKWDDMLFIFEPPPEAEESLAEPSSETRYSSIDTLKNDDSAKSPNSIVEFRTPRMSPTLPMSDNDLWSNNSISDRSSGSSQDEQDDDELSPEKVSKSKSRKQGFRRLIKSNESEKTESESFDRRSSLDRRSSPEHSPLPSVTVTSISEQVNDFKSINESPDSASLYSSTSDSSEDLPNFHARQRSNLSSSDIDLLSDVERKELIKEQLQEFTYLPPLPDEPIYDFPYESDMSDNDIEPPTPPQLPQKPMPPARRRRPPPIPLRLRERSQQVSP